MLLKKIGGAVGLELHTIELGANLVQFFCDGVFSDVEILEKITRHFFASFGLKRF